uniref:Uncharacterized protein n=1 Tax=viral metagenome TaxID=1070528 RepID=A0A6C0F016_9ZZZZ
MMSSALSLLKLDEMDEKEKRCFELERKNDLIKSMLDYVKLANEFLENNRLNEINKTEEECDTLAKWFSTHYHCLYVPPYRESQKKTANGNPYLPLGWALRFTGTFMAQPEYYDTLINLHLHLRTRIPSWRDDPVIAKLIIGEDNGFSD